MHRHRRLIVTFRPQAAAVRPTQSALNIPPYLSHPHHCFFDLQCPAVKLQLLALAAPASQPP